MRQLLTTCEGPVSTVSTRAVGTTAGSLGRLSGTQYVGVHVERVVPVVWRDLLMNDMADAIARPGFAKAPKAPWPPRGSP
jgi:hypothetical protein